MEDNKNNITKGTIIYYARYMEFLNIFELLELKLRTVEDNWYVGIDNRSKHAYLFYEKDIGKTIFFDRKEALKIVKDAEKNCKKEYSNEKYYEEY